MTGPRRDRHLAFRLALLLMSGVLCLGQSPPRHALLMGVANYAGLPVLATPLSDARAVAAALRDLQFQTTLVENPNLDRIDQSLSQFLQSIKPGDVALIYYSGYAVQDSGENYLVPVNYDAGKNLDTDYSAYSVSRILSDVASRKPATAILILDAAREARALRERFPAPGLALIEPRNPDHLIVFSASAGKYSREISGRPLSVLTQALVDNLSKPGLSTRQFLDEVRQSVNQATKGEQIPTEISSMVQPFVINTRSPAAEAWERVRNSADVAVLEDFRQKFPNSTSSGEAGRRIEQLDWERASQAKALKTYRDFLTRHPSGAYSDAARTEIAKLEAAETLSANRRLVDESLMRYREAFEARDMDALKTVWPGLDRTQLNSFQSFFRLARTIKLELRPQGEPSISGDKATIRCRRIMTATDERGPMPSQDQMVEIAMSKSGGLMVIDTVRVVGR